MSEWFSEIAFYQVQQVLEGRLKAQNELNSTLKENCELLEQLLFRSDSKEAKVRQQLEQLNSERQADQAKFAETVTMLKSARKTLEKKIASLKVIGIRFLESLVSQIKYLAFNAAELLF